MYAPSVTDNTGIRLAPASRTRLRHGKLIKVDKTDICDCTLYDLQNGGTGVVIPDAEADLPDTLYVADTKLATVNLAKVRWRVGSNLGVLYLEKPVQLSLKQSAKTK
ncbi:hypothetical protein [Roseibium alexandrii]|jgi:hypothetical protein|uniref:PilZ domain-containing protein n=1 Tax=Roseibium alexandrii (strain DSM 17067 / NCIMB 14079 / DFL-11) TaxID=244592 RepID=A0A5E8H6R7_ROSAD|nr:hypothetical protein [Roseibium alexandrii]EEE47866.2 hypothetical protein SADFL11_5156 [Roseibium alexandrii DFL-11]